MAFTPRPARRSRRRSRLPRTGLTTAVAAAIALALPGALVIAAEESPSPSPVVTERPVPLDRPSRPVRLRVPFAGIDLPVISSERNVAGNPAGYPLCDVAQYWTRFGLPGEPGTTWLLAHAQPGMFLPLYTITAEGGTNALVGKRVKLQLRDKRLLTYRITEVRPRVSSTDVSIAKRPNNRAQRLILQTSTGYGSDPKLQLAAKLIKAEWTDQPRPVPKPRACWQPAPEPTPKGRKDRATRGTPTPEPVEVIEAGDDIDTVALLVGSGAVLLGTTVVAVYIVRRP